MTGVETTTTADRSAGPDSLTIHDRLMRLLDTGGARYRVITHPPEGNTVAASRLRGHAVEQAAKCIVVRVKLKGKNSRYVLAVVPGDRRIDLDLMGRVYGGRSAHFAAAQTAERLSGTVSGAVLPFSFHPDLELVADPDLLDHHEIFFNAARLTSSLALNTEDYVRLARPRLLAVGQPADVAAESPSDDTQ